MTAVIFPRGEPISTGARTSLFKTNLQQAAGFKKTTGEFLPVEEKITADGVHAPFWPLLSRPKLRALFPHCDMMSKPDFVLLLT